MIAITCRIIIISLLLMLALVSDLRTYKIKNFITYTFMLVGFTANSSLEGLKGMMFSLQGIILPAVCLVVLYMMRIIGAGDIKLLSAIGAVMGAGFVSYATLYSFLCGGFVALALILIRRNGIERLKHLFVYIKSCFISMELLEYANFEDKDGSKFHFSIAVASGTITAIIIHGIGLL